MPQPRKPTAIHELSGSYKVHPERRADRQGEPEPDGPIGDAPESFSDDERAMWDELVSIAHAGVPTRADRPAMEMLSRMFARFRAREEMTAAELARIHSLLASFGMTPADRSRVKAPPKKEANPFAEFSH
jgi:hypothetical protein